MYKLDVGVIIFVEYIDDCGCFAMEKLNYIKMQTYTTGKHTSIYTPNMIILYTEEGHFRELNTQSIIRQAEIADKLRYGNK